MYSNSATRKIKEVVKLYVLNVPRLNQQAANSFFDSSSMETCYFRTRNEAELYKEMHSVNTASIEVLAVQDKDRRGNDQYVLIKITEDMKYSNHNKQVNTNDYYARHIAFEMDNDLKDYTSRGITENNSVVVAVKPSRETDYETGGEYGGPSYHTTYYTFADKVESNTRFLYVSKTQQCFIERDKEVTLTDASQLVIKREWEKNQMEIARLQEEQEHLRHQFK